MPELVDPYGNQSVRFKLARVEITAKSDNIGTGVCKLVDAWDFIRILYNCVWEYLLNFIGEEAIHLMRTLCGFVDEPAFFGMKHSQFHQRFIVLNINDVLLDALV